MALAQLISIDLDQRDGSFISEVLAAPTFRRDGIAYGRGDDNWWAVVDPQAHPLYIWGQREGGLTGYARTASSRGASLFTNGPMMGKRLAPTQKMTRRRAMWEFVKWMGVGGVAGAAFGPGLRARALTGLGGAAVGFATAYRRSFTGWLACGTVRSQENRIEDARNFDDEGKTHVWFGRSSCEFNSYQVGEGDLPGDVAEGVGGMILLVRDYRPAYEGTHEARFRDYARLYKKKGVVAWSLIPTGQQQGVLLVLGSEKLNLAEVTVRLCAVGARDAVATDQRGMIMMGSGAQFMIGPPATYRQGMQLYGLCCR